MTGKMPCMAGRYIVYNTQTNKTCIILQKRANRRHFQLIESKKETNMKGSKKSRIKVEMCIGNRKKGRDRERQRDREKGRKKEKFVCQMNRPILSCIEHHHIMQHNCSKDINDK